MLRRALAAVVTLVLCSAVAQAQTTIIPNNVFPNPSTYGTPVRFDFTVYPSICDYDMRALVVGRVGDVLRVQYELFPRPMPICFSGVPPGWDASVDLGVLPPGNYIARSEGYLDGSLVFSRQAPFRVLGVTSESVPALSHWALAVLGLLVLGVALLGRRWISPGA